MILINHMKLVNKLFLSCLVAGITADANAVITLSANNSGGGGRQVTTSTGTLLAAGTGSIRIGYFADSNSAVLKSGDWAAINSLFIPLGETPLVAGSGTVTNPVGVTPGNPIPIPSAATAGRFNGSVTSIVGNFPPNPNPGGFYLPSGTRIFLLLSNSADPRNVAPTEFALVTDSIWVAPQDDPNIPGGNSLTMAMNTTNLNDAATDVYWGALASTGATTNFLRLAAPVPEPSVVSLAGLCSLLFFQRRRR